MSGLGIYEAAAELGYSSFWLRDLAQRRMIRASKVKGRWVIPPDEVERLRRLDGPLARRVRWLPCAALDCARMCETVGKQRFCSKRCQHRTYMRRYREAA